MLMPVGKSVMYIPSTHTSFGSYGGDFNLWQYSPICCILFHIIMILAFVFFTYFIVYVWNECKLISICAGLMVYCMLLLLYLGVCGFI